VILSLAATALAAPTAHPAEPPARRPNVVFILADDLGYADLGCYGQEKIRTPNIDRLAADGLRFTQHYAGCTVCAPSRCTLMTGRHTGHTPIRGNRETKPEGQVPLPAGTFTVGRLFQQAGYRTACVGKWGLGMVGTTGDPNANGFDHYFGHVCQAKAHNHFPEYLWRDGQKVELTGNRGGKEGEYAGDLFTREALEFVRESKDRPFFLYLAYTAPHLALQVPEDSLAEYRGRWPDPPYDGKKGYRPHPTPRAAYAAMITRMDHDIGRLMALLKDLGLDGNTLVFFSSDNGPTFVIGGADSAFFHSAGPLRGLKQSMYEGGIRVPLIARWPGHVRPGTTTDHVSAFWDFLPTCADLLGVAPPKDTDGLSYLPTLLGRGAEQKRHEYLYWENAEGQRRVQAARKGDWKAVYDVTKDSFELFDLAHDLGETTDVAAKYLEAAREMRAILMSAHVETPDFPLLTPLKRQR
jgi:arylsulfatase A-like enzyme